MLAMKAVTPSKQGNATTQHQKNMTPLQSFKNFGKNQVQIEMRNDDKANNKLDIEEYILNNRHSNSEGLPEID